MLTISLQFVDESKIERLKHEKSSKHQFALKKQLRDLHKKNKDEHRELKLAQQEIRRIKSEIGGDKKLVKQFTTSKVQKPSRDRKTEKRETEPQPLLPNMEWQQTETQTEAVEKVEFDISEPVQKLHRNTRQTVGEKELNSWDLNEVRQIDLDHDDDDVGVEKIVFKKKKKF